MRLSTGAMAAVAMTLTTLVPSQGAADAKIYAYPSKANYCPAGLQPITISGVICCGTPNQSVTYQQVMAHPVRRHKPVRHHYVRSARAHCQAGLKGCD
ncbi:hypothetical protein [Sulfitobacter alexandrii]|nr:hypothetical protein [Sulfitobacter alexandrii]